MLTDSPLLPTVILRRPCLPCPAQAGARQAKCPRTSSSTKGMCFTYHRIDGRFFAALRMTCFPIAIVEMYPSFASPNCHPEEAALPAGESLAGRLTKDLLRHRSTHARFARVPSPRGGTFAPPQPRRGGANVDGIPIYGHFDKLNDHVLIGSAQAAQAMTTFR